ncbi:hypothetical protein BZA77DRAFT_307315 [Pyronema omphalodes]|nr:hypothetical protein BZA77DRAFT_307315 [Pyronema omphalodes]
MFLCSLYSARLCYAPFDPMLFFSCALLPSLFAPVLFVLSGVLSFSLSLALYLSLSLSLILSEFLVSCASSLLFLHIRLSSGLPPSDAS